MPRKKGSGGDRFCMTIPKDLRAMVQGAAVERAKEGEAIGERAMLDRLLRVGAIMGMRCQGCRSGKCPRHVAMVRPSEGRATKDTEARQTVTETFEQLLVLECNPAPTVPLNLDKPGKITEESSQKSIEESVPTKTFVLATVEPAKKPERKPRAKKAITEDSPEFTRLIDVYHVEFVRVRKEKPAYTSRDFAAFRSLLKSQGFDRACELIHNAFAHIFWANRVTIRKIADNPSEFVGDVAASPRRSSGQVEPDENFFVDQERRWSQETAS